MKITKIIAAIMVLVLALSAAACNIGLGGETTPTETPAPTPSMTVEEVVEVAKTYFSGTNFNMSGTSHTVVTGEEGYDETVNVTAQMVGIGTEDFKLFFATDSEKSGFMKVIYVGGTTYTHMNMMNMEFKLKQEQPVDEVMDEYSLDLFPFTASMKSTSHKGIILNCICKNNKLSTTKPAFISSF